MSPQICSRQTDVTSVYCSSLSPLWRWYFPENQFHDIMRSSVYFSFSNEEVVKPSLITTPMLAKPGEVQ